MAPFDDTTLARSNVSKKKPGNRFFTFDSDHVKQRKERHSRQFPPVHYPPPPNYGSDYYLPPPHHPLPYHAADGVDMPQDHHLEDFDSYYENPYSTTPIAIDTPQRSNTASSKAEARNRDQMEKHEAEHHARSGVNDDVRDGEYDANWTGYHKSSDYYHGYPPYHAHGREYSTHEHEAVPASTEAKSSSKNTSATSSRPATATHIHRSRDGRNPSPRYPLTYHPYSGWYSPGECPPEAFPPHQEVYDRRFFSPSPPPYPPSPHPDYYIPSSDSFESRASPPPMSWYEGGRRGSFDEQDFPGRWAPPMPHYSPSHPPAAFHHHHQGRYEHPNPPRRSQEEEEDEQQRPATPSSNQTVARTPNVTPGSKAKGRNSPSAMDESTNSHLHSSPAGTSKAIVTPDDKGASTFEPSSPFVSLRESDIVCGRGAPTNFHVGNSQFKDLVQDYHRPYFVAKRSDKPRIAIKVLDILASRGARFVRRVKGRSLPLAQWEEVAHKIAYEKVCQALRDAGAAPRQMQSLSALKSKSSGNRRNLPHSHSDQTLVVKNASGEGEEEKENSAIDHF